MATRSRTRSATSKVPHTTSTPKLQTKSMNRNQKDPQHNVDISSGHEGKEVKDKATKISNVKPKKTKKSLRSVLCFCSKEDDGSPMILCSECKIWYVYYQLILFFSVFTGTKNTRYHFTCVNLSEPEAEEISEYCPSPKKFRV